MTSLFPLVRFLSAATTPVLLATPITANAVTALSLVAGLAAAHWLMTGTYAEGLYAAAALIACYVLDNCDGEIARRKNQCTTFGAHFDTFVDWVVHACFFFALGLGTTARTGEPVWTWLGFAAAGGATANYFLGLYLDHRARDDNDQGTAPQPEAARPEGSMQWLIYIFRELTRADFCFLVLILAAFDALWVLVPLGAVGAQAYWLLGLYGVARRFHV